MTDREPEDILHDSAAAPSGAARYRSLDDAFRDHGTPVENRLFLRRILAGIDVEAYLDRGTYIKVTRPGGGPAIQIHYGYSNGYRSQDLLGFDPGEVERWQSARGSGLWVITHPVNRLRSGDGAGTAMQERRSWGYCASCGYALPATGLCGYCG